MCICVLCVLCPSSLTPYIPTSVEEFLEALGTLAEHCPHLLLLERTPSHLQGFCQGHMHPPWGGERGGGEDIVTGYLHWTFHCINHTRRKYTVHNNAVREKWHSLCGFLPVSWESYSEWLYGVCVCVTWAICEISGKKHEKNIASADQSYYIWIAALHKSMCGYLTFQANAQECELSNLPLEESAIQNIQEHSHWFILILANGTFWILMR